MQPFEFNTENTLAAVQGAFMQLSALAISYSVSVIGAVVLLIAGSIVARYVRRGSHAALIAIPGFDETLARFFSNLLRYAVLLLVGVTVLAQFGVQTASVLAALGAVGLAIGLALQGTLQNIAAGVMLLVLRPFRVGESIEAGSVTGRIVEIGLFATEIRRLDGVYVLAPNSELWKSPVTNLTRNPERRNDIVVGIGYGDDISQAQSTLVEIAAAEPMVLHEPGATAFVSELGESTVSLTLRYWTQSGDFLKARMTLTKAVKLAFDHKGISMPVPQQEVTYKLVDGSAPPALPLAAAATAPAQANGAA